MSENSSTGSFKKSLNGAHTATGNTGRLSGRGNTVTNKATAITGVFKATSTSGRHEAFQPPKQERRKMDPRKKRKLYIASVLAAAVLVVGAAVTFKISTSKTKYDNYYENARQCYLSGDYDNALANIRRAETIKSTDECIMLMADCYYRQENYDKALETLRTLNISDTDVKNKIAEIENVKDEQMNSSMISFGTVQYDLRSTSIDLSAQHLGNEVFINLEQMYSVTNLNISSNDITNLEGIENLGGIISLDLSMNRITDINPLKKLENLRMLNIDGNPVNDLSALYSMSNLTSLSIRGISITEEQLYKLSEALPGCAIHSVGEDTSAQDITIGGKTFKSDVTELDLSYLSLTDISAISQCKNLTSLSLKGNNISDISPVMDLPLLNWLDLSDNAVSDLRALISLNSIKYLDVSNNQVTTTNALGAMNELEELYLDGNSIADFSGIKKMYSLKTLSIKNTGLKESDLDNIKNLLNLRNLYIEDNPEITGEIFDKFTITMQNCKISHSPLVYSVIFNAVSYKENITELVVTGSELTAIDEIVKFKYLQKIDFSDNNISNIYTFQYSCKDIVSLDLSHNNISDITPISSLKDLKYLDLSYNKISFITPLLNLTELSYLNLKGNDIPEDQMVKLRNTLTKCEIVY